MSGLRFCFVSYEDNAQEEEGDTLTHTWNKPNWPYCVTKWCYFWGTKEGEISKSTSPIFKYHNSTIQPAMILVFLEQWTGYVPPLTFVLAVLEKWGTEAPAMKLAVIERWGTPTPAMVQSVLEPWSS